MNEPQEKPWRPGELPAGSPPPVRWGPSPFAKFFVAGIKEIKKAHPDPREIQRIIMEGL